MAGSVFVVMFYVKLCFGALCWVLVLESFLVLRCSFFYGFVLLPCFNNCRN